MKAKPRMYRAMRVGTEEWVEGSLIDWKDGDYSIAYAGKDKDGQNLWPVSANTVGQSTGELDQLNQPLWQDDVCKDLRGDRWLIIWKKGAFWLENMETKCRWLLDGGKVERVGTIYDSPAKLYADAPKRSSQGGHDDEE